MSNPPEDQAQYMPASGYPQAGYQPQSYPAQGYPQPGYPPPIIYQQVQAKSPTNGLAIASMVLGIIWVWWVGSILAVIFGHVALRQIARDGKQGRGMAIAGLVLGYVGVATLAIFIALLIAGAASGGSGSG
jgi:hypothetical protein